MKPGSSNLSAGRQRKPERAGARRRAGRPAVRMPRAAGGGAREGIVEFPCDVERLPNGNTLIADAGDEAGQGSEVVEVTPRGEIAWRYAEGLRFAHSAKRLSGGNTLIADTTNDRVIEVTPGGKLAFSSDDWGDGAGRLSDGSHLAYPNDAHEIPGGNLLVTDRNNDRAVEVTRAGRVVWQHAGKVRHPHNADRLPNGNTLICDSDGQYVREVTPAGEVVWSYGDGSRQTLNWPRDADRVPNDNTLITDSKNRRIIEVTPEGRMAWQYQADYFANFYDADRLPNGNTLISGQQHQEVFEVSPSGERVWEFRNYTRAYPVNARLLNAKFAELNAVGAPAHWILARRLSEGGGELAWRENPAGKRCPGLAYDRDGALCLQQTVAVKPGRAYQVSGLVMAEGVEGLAFLQMAFLDDKNGLLRDVIEAPKGRLLCDTTGWLRDAFGAAAPPGAAAAEVRLFITGRGRVFVDELSCKG